MRIAKRVITALMLAAMLVAMLSTSAFAAENGNAWLSVNATDDGVTVISVLADAPVTDAYVELTFGDELEYLATEADAAYVSYHSVNADEAGLVKLAWVSEGNYVAEGGVCLFTLTFQGVYETLPAVSGYLHDAEGNALELQVVQSLDYTALKKAVLAAQGLKAENYTAESYAALETALENGLAMLEKEPVSQEELDAAADALNAAIAALVLAESSAEASVNTDELAKLVLLAEGLQEIMYSEDSFAAMTDALAAAREVLANADATQEQVDAAADALRQAIDALVLISADAPNTGSVSLTKPVAVLLVLSAVGLFAAAFVLITKKGRCAK